MIIKKGFTLAEVVTALLVIAVVASVTMKITSERQNYINKILYYSAFINLKQMTGELITQGCPEDGNKKKLTVVSGDSGYTSGLGAVNVCTRLLGILNVVYQGNSGCSASTIGSYPLTSSTYFNTNLASYMNFSTSNGLRFFNFKADADANKNFTIYVDVNGARGSGIIDQDVIAFIVNNDGTVLPHPSSIIATDVNALSASVRYTNASNQVIAVENKIPYKQAVCDANATYGGTACARSAAAAICATQTCNVIINKPGY